MTKTGVEYADWNLTVYPQPCDFRCRYCWASQPLWQKRIAHPYPLQEAVRLRNMRKPRTVVVSFTSDAYVPKEAVEHLTRRTLEILSTTKHKVMILTKSVLAEKDFPFFFHWRSEGMNLWLGTTLTSVIGIEDEPLASPNPQRIKMLETAHHLGLKTWASVEPWIPNVTYPDQIVEATYPFVDFYIMGKLNYAKRFGYHIPDGYYKRELPRVVELLDKLGKPFLIKKELKKEVGL